MPGYISSTIIDTAPHICDEYLIDTQDHSSYTPTVKKQCLINISIVRRTDSLFLRLNDPNTNLGKLTRNDALYRHLDHSIISPDSLLMDFKQNPSRYVKVSVF